MLSGDGLVSAFGILVFNHTAISNLIREGKTRQLRNVIATQQSEGTQTLERSLNSLVEEGAISPETAFHISLYAKE